MLASPMHNVGFYLAHQVSILLSNLRSEVLLYPTFDVQAFCCFTALLVEDGLTAGLSCHAASLHSLIAILTRDFSSIVS